MTTTSEKSLLKPHYGKRALEVVRPVIDLFEENNPYSASIIVLNLAGDLINGLEIGERGDTIDSSFDQKALKIAKSIIDEGLDEKLVPYGAGFRSKNCIIAVYGLSLSQKICLMIAKMLAAAIEYYMDPAPTPSPPGKKKTGFCF